MIQLNLTSPGTVLLPFLHLKHTLFILSAFLCGIFFYFIHHEIFCLVFLHTWETPPQSSWWILFCYPPEDRLPPSVVVNKGMGLDENSAKKLTTLHLSASDQDSEPGELIYRVTKQPSLGHLEHATNPGINHSVAYKRLVSMLLMATCLISSLINKNDNKEGQKTVVCIRSLFICFSLSFYRFIKRTIETTNWHFKGFKWIRTTETHQLPDRAALWSWCSSREGRPCSSWYPIHSRRQIQNGIINYCSFRCHTQRYWMQAQINSCVCVVKVIKASLPLASAP